MSLPWLPKNYHLSAISFVLTNMFGALFLDPGLGKTATTLACIKTLMNLGEYRGVLLIAPMRVCYSTWPREIKKWVNFNGTKYTILHGKTKNTLWENHDLYLINPEGIPWLFKELLTGLKAGEELPFDILWIDESTKFKNPTSKARFELISDMLCLFKRRYIMTGTPAPRGLLDLWSQIFILDLGKALCDNFYHFRNKYFYTEEWARYNWKLKDFAEDQIKEAIAPIVLEMSADDYLNLPEILYNDIPIILSAKAMAHYKDMEHRFFMELDDLQSSSDTRAQAMMRCHQIANGSVYEDIPEELTSDEEKAFRKTRKTIHVHSEKASALRDLVDELNGKPLLIAYHYKHDLEAIKSVLGEAVPYIGSGISRARESKLEDAWNAGELPYLVGHPDSISHGLNLQGAGNDICWFSMTWNLENYLQFIRRIYRQGVTGKVRVHHLIAENTIDEAMLSRLGEKAEQQHSLREAIKQYRLTLIV